MRNRRVKPISVFHCDQPFAYKLHIVQAAYRSLQVDGRVANFYLLEIARSIERCMLLSAIQLATTLLELWLRDLLVLRRAAMETTYSKHEMRWHITRFDKSVSGVECGVPMGDLLKELIALKVLTDEEALWVKNTYERVRNPLRYGFDDGMVEADIVMQLTKKRPKSKDQIFIAGLLASDYDRRTSQFGKYIELEILKHLEGIVNFLGRHQIPTIQW